MQHPKKNTVTCVIPLFFKVGMLKVLPMGTIAGLKITELDEQQCKVTVPYKYINKNPFQYHLLGRTGYGGGNGQWCHGTNVHAQAGNPSVSMFVTGCEGKFLKRAVGITYLYL